MVNVLIVDQHPVARCGLMSFLQEARQFGILGEAATGQDALAQVRAATWDVLVLELNLPDIDSLELLDRIEAQPPPLPVLVFSPCSLEAPVMPLLRFRVAGCVSKESELAEVARAIQSVAAGKRYFSQDVLERFAGPSAGRADLPAHRRLSVREYQIMLRLAAGQTNRAIARDLAIDHRTVSTHRWHILTKLGFRSNADLTRYAIDHQLLA